MAKDLVNSQELAGMTFKAVVQKLGSPDSTFYIDMLDKDGVPNPDPKELRIATYFLHTPYDRLDISFSPSGVVSYTIMGTTGTP